MYFFMLHEFFDAMEVFEQLVDIFRAPEDIRRHLHDPVVDQWLAVSRAPAKSEILSFRSRTSHSRRPTEPDDRGGVFEGLKCLEIDW